MHVCHSIWIAHHRIHIDRTRSGVSLSFLWFAGVVRPMQSVSSPSSARVALLASPQQHSSKGGLPVPAPAARRLFAPDQPEVLLGSCGMHLESACSSNVGMLEQICRRAFESPPCPAPAPHTPTISFDLLRRAPRQLQQNAGGARACRMLPGLAPGDDAHARQQLRAWLSCQEAELATAAAAQHAEFVRVA